MQTISAYINGRLSRWTGILYPCLLALGDEVELHDPSSDGQSLACLLMHRDRHPHLRINWGLKAKGLAFFQVGRLHLLLTTLELVL